MGREAGQGWEWKGLGRTEVINILHCVTVFVSTMQAYLVLLPLALLPFGAAALSLFLRTEGLGQSRVHEAIGAFFATALLTWCLCCHILVVLVQVIVTMEKDCCYLLKTQVMVSYFLLKRVFLIKVCTLFFGGT